MAYVPDFFTLANQQSDANNAATDATNTANRSNQTGAMGNLTWTQGPNGQWTQSTALNGGAQGLFDSTMQGQMGLASTIGGGLNYGSAPAMPTVGGYNQQVIDSWNALAQPGVQKQSDAARARAAAMGITLGSNASNDVERNIGTSEATQRNQAILAGYTQGNTEFDQALRARAQGTGEAKDAYQAAISGSSALGSMRDSLNPNKWLGADKASAAYAPKNIYGAAMDTYNAQRANENADIQQRNSNISTGAGVLGSLGGLSGIGSAASGLWNWGSNIYNGWNGDNFFSAGNDSNWGGNWTPGEDFLTGGA